MMHPHPHSVSLRTGAWRWLVAAAVATVALTAPLALRAQTTTPAAPAGLSALKGIVIDSVHGQPLQGATVFIEGTARKATTSDLGEFLVDSIPAGKHRVVVAHPLLDTLGISMRTPEYSFVAGTTHDIDLFIPGGEKLASILCNPIMRQRGPAVMVGFVKDPDTNAPATGSKVSLVFNVTDIVGRKSVTVREATVDSTGLYHICGLPADMSGKVQVFRNGVSSGEVPVEVANNIAVRAFSVAQHQTVIVVKNDSTGKVKRIAKGSARVTGKVVDKNGRPLSGARIQLQGGSAVAISKPNGDFTLDSLPSGTQAIEVRKLGYAATDVPVELSSNEPAKATVTMGDFVPVLETMKVEAAANSGLSKVGYLERKQSGMGYYLDGNQINHQSMAFSDVMRVVPGLRISPAGDGRTYVIQDSRDATGGCVNFWVDGTQWQTMSPGDIDQYVRPDELVAVEVYHGSGTPVQFTSPGQSGCATIVAWTVARVRPDSKSSKKP